jgi:predicted O-methyltransferase YrrM
LSADDWSAFDEYVTDLLIEHDPAGAALEANRAAGLPPINVPPSQGAFLHVLARAIGARSILEIGTLGGYSTIWLARALPADGRLITLEANPDYAALARANFVAAGVADVVDVVVGPALESLPRLQTDGHGPFDLAFIDADKPNNPEYFAWALRLSRPGSLIIVDNVVRGGAVLDADSDDANVQGTRRMFELIATEPRVTATAIQTVGSKGYDGFAIAFVTA